MAAAKKTVQFSLPELRDLLSHVRDNRDSGVYWGNQEQFYARQQRIIEKLEEALGEKEVDA